MKYLSKRILMNLVFIVYFICLKLNSILQDFAFYFGLITILYGVTIIVSYIVFPETKYGESKILSLLFGVIFLVLGPVILFLGGYFSNICNYLIALILMLQGIGRILSQSHRGKVIKIVQIVDGISLLVFAFMIVNIFKLAIFSNIESYCLIGFIISLVDIIVVILAITLPRDDMINEKVKLHYASFEDKTNMEDRTKAKDKKNIEKEKKVKRSKTSEYIDLARLNAQKNDEIL